MRKYTQKEIRTLVRLGYADDITKAGAITEPYTIVGTSRGVYGVNGAVLQGDTTGTLYAITARSSSLFRYV